MLRYSFVMSDCDRARAFAVLCRTQGMFKSSHLARDSEGLPWSIVNAEGIAFGVPLLGQGWAFDPHAQRRRRDRLEERHAQVFRWTEPKQREELHKTTVGLRFGPLTNRLLWYIHQTMISRERSVFRLPDDQLREAMWGRNDRPPVHWRKEVHCLLDSLSYLHVAAHSDDHNEVSFNAQTALLTHFADLRSKSSDSCDDDCPADSERHSHFLINVGRGFLGCLEQFASADDENGVRSYAFPRIGGRGERTLRTAGKRGKISSTYLPAFLSSPTCCRSLTFRQRQLVQTIVRETTRNTKKNRKDFADAEIFIGNLVPPVQAGQRKKNYPQIVCPLLNDELAYVGFNGNKTRKGRGYLLPTWMRYAGYDESSSRVFFRDLRALVEQLGLYVVGLHPRKEKWLNLDELESTCECRPSLARTLHIRLYSREDYVSRWNTYFDWQTPSDAIDVTVPTVTIALGLLEQHSIRRCDAADGLGIDRSLFSKMLTGKRPLHEELVSRLQDWIKHRTPEIVHPNVTIPVPPPNCLSTSRTGTSSVATLDMALEYRRRGWSVIPQIPGQKKPPIKWKEFQETRPAESEIRDWWRQWPDAGIAVIAGPLSDVLVVDVDSKEAHEVLLERLGNLPDTPSVKSGSCEPNRYHMFFKHPPIETKAQATPWHPKLEFRGHRSLTILPPSLHKSGNRYEWFDGRSLDQLVVPDLPSEILAALTTVKQVRPEVVATEVTTLNVSPSTHEFLSGRWANGPKWNLRLFQAACDLASREFQPQQAEALLIAGAAPWNASEAEDARRTIESAFSQPREPSFS